MNENGQNCNDEYILIPLNDNEKIVVGRQDLSLRGAWISGHYVEGNDLSEELKMRAHAIIRQRTFDIVGDKNEGGA